MNSTSLVTDEVLFQIQPDDIDANEHFWNAFDNNETEISAAWIVRLCQERGGWVPFTDDEMEAYYNRGGHQNFRFSQLLDNRGRWVVKGDDGKYRVTVNFIARCFGASPAPMSR